MITTLDYHCDSLLELKGLALQPSSRTINLKALLKSCLSAATFWPVIRRISPGIPETSYEHMETK